MGSSLAGNKGITRDLINALFQLMVPNPDFARRVASNFASNSDRHTTARPHCE